MLVYFSLFFGSIFILIANNYTRILISIANIKKISASHLSIYEDFTAHTVIKKAQPNGCAINFLPKN